MKGKLFWIVILVAAFYGYSGYKKRHQFALEDSSAGVSITKGENEFLFEDAGSFRADLRVFGFNENTLREVYGPLTLITHSFIAQPMADNEEVFADKMCEAASVDKAAQLNIIVQDETVLNKVRAIEASTEQRKCVRIEARSLVMKRLMFRGEDHTEGWNVSSQFSVDPYRYVLVSGIEQIQCGAL